MKRVAVFCGSGEGNSKEFVELATKVGTQIGENGLALVYGGASIGMMGAVADAALLKNAQVWGIMPKYFMEGQWRGEIAHTGLTHFEVTDDMHTRKLRMYELSDAFISLPGGLGTMDEFFEITTWGQLGLHTKPIGILNSNGYYDALIMQSKTMVEKGFLKQENLDAVVVDDSIEGLLEKMNNYKPLPAPKWLNTERL